MDLDVGLGTLLDQKADAPRLITRKILIDDATARQYQREIFIGHFFRRLVFNRMKLRFAIGMIETFLEQSRRARMIFRRTRPEDAVVLLDLFPRDAVVIGIAAARRDPQFVE